MELGRGLLLIGTPAQRTEELLCGVTHKLGMSGEVFSTPTAVLAMLSGPQWREMRLVRSRPGDVDLSKLVAVEAIAQAVAEGAASPSEGLLQLRSVLKAPPRFGGWTLLLSIGIASSAIALGFGGGPREALAAGIVGLSIGGLGALARVWTSLERVFDMVAALSGTLVAFVAAMALGAAPLYLVTVAGVVVLLPGLTLTTAIKELSTQHLVSGTARLVGAGVTFLKLAFGVALGGKVAMAVLRPDPLLFSPPIRDLGEVALPAEATSLLVACLAFMVVFQALPRHGGWIILAGLFAVLGSELGTHWLGPELGPCLGAFLAAGCSNLVAYRKRLPTSLFLTPSIVLLVPGTIGFKGVSLLLDRDIVSGVDRFFSMTLSAMSLVAGVLFANLVIARRRAL